MGAEAETKRNTEEKLYLQAWQKMLCIRPYYWPDGRLGAEVILEKGQREYLRIGCRTAVEHLSKRFFTTTEQVRQQAEQWLNDEGRRKLPLILHRDLCLIPLHFADGIGYVVHKKLRHITCPKEDTGSTRLYFYRLEEGIDIAQSLKSTVQQNRLAYLLLGYYEEHHGIQC